MFHKHFLLTEFRFNKKIMVVFSIFIDVYKINAEIYICISEQNLLVYCFLCPPSKKWGVIALQMSVRR